MRVTRPTSFGEANNPNSNRSHTFSVYKYESSENFQPAVSDVFKRGNFRPKQTIGRIRLGIRMVKVRLEKPDTMGVTLL